MFNLMLNELLFLGQIPGTNIQITFSDYLFLVDIALVLLLLRKKHLLPHGLKHYWHYGRLYFSVKQGQQLSLPV